MAYPKEKIQNLATVAAATLWIFLGSLRVWTAIQSRSALPALIAAQSFLMGYRLIKRRKDENNPHPWYVRAFIIVSVFMGPLFLQVNKSIPLIGTIISGIGVLVSLWAMWTLGEAFGIAPADRGLVTHGPYRFIRHPMYAGALINIIPVAIWNPTLWNLGLSTTIAVIIIWRSRLEERTVSTYEQYAESVRWRLIPFIW